MCRIDGSSSTTKTVLVISESAPPPQPRPGLARSVYARPEDAPNASIVTLEASSRRESLDKRPHPGLAEAWYAAIASLDLGGGNRWTNARSLPGTWWFAVPVGAVGADCADT